MTENKPIIIDGVDVSECIHYGSQNNCIIYGNEKCDRFPNCCYKQLHRKTQECEELKREIAFGNNGALSDKIRAEVFKELNNENNQFKAENEKYKKKLQEFFNIDNQECWNAAFLQNEKAKAEQKLERIKDIAKDFHYAIIPFHRGINHEMADRIDYYLNQILQIIYEVE